MPDWGLLTAGSLTPVARAEAPGVPALPWVCPGTRILQCLYETRIESVLQELPMSLPRTVPPIVELLIADCPDSPVGPFRAASLSVAGRWRTLARMVPVYMVVDSPRALEGLRHYWSYPARQGEVHLDPVAEGMTASARATDGAVRFALRAGELEPITAGEMKIDSRAIVRPPGAAGEPPEIVQHDRHDAITECYRTHCAVELAIREGPDFPCWYEIASTVSVSESTLAAPRAIIPFDLR